MARRGGPRRRRPPRAQIRRHRHRRQRLGPPAFPPPPAARNGGELYIYRNTFNLVPRSIGGCRGELRALKFFGNDVEVLPPEAGELDELESLQVKVSAPRVSGAPLSRMRALKELELSMVPPRPSACSILAEVAGLKCLTKLTICHFSIRYLPPEIGSLRKLQELDLSFNKLKNLPNCITELGALKFLKVTNNKLVDLPSGISSLRCLESLDVSNNRLTSLRSVKFGSLLTLQYLNLQFNRISHSYVIPSWICCDMRGNGENALKGDKLQYVGIASTNSSAEPKSVSRSCNGVLSCSHPETSPNLKAHSTQKMKKGWKRRDCLQQQARQERLDSSRSKFNEKYIDEMSVNMTEDECPSSLHDMANKPEMKGIDEETSVQDLLKETSPIPEDLSCIVDDDSGGLINDSGMMLQDHYDEEKPGINMRSYHGNRSCVSTDPACLSRSRIRSVENEIEDTASSACNVAEFVEENPSETSKFTSKSKRHPDMDSNPKPSKCPRPIDECSKLSYKYSVESFCSIDDHLPDGFYDAGRDMPFMPLEEYERSLGLYAREVILLDREQDEELDAIASSAQLLLSSLKRPSFSETDEDAGHDLLRASMLALFVSDCFGGCDRSASLRRTRRAIVTLRKEQPFICTCSAGSICDSNEASKQIDTLSGHFDFTRLCDKSIHIIKERRNSGIVPIGALQFGVCRHRAVLMKYLCDRADPPIPCELVRGHLDYTPHAWNVVPVRKGNTWVRMIVDACYPTNIKEETDPEYFCRYVPLSRLQIILDDQGYTPRSPFPSVSLCKEIETTASSSVYYCKIGAVDAAAKVRYLDTRCASSDEVKNFEYKLLAEVRMLGALRKHQSIVEIYGHQLYSKWVQADSDKEYRVLQSIILMEYVKGGSLKGYLTKLLKEGKKHVPIDLAFYIAREVACALLELHKKLVIHRDIKSENVLVDLDSKRSHGTPVVKLSDFDRSIPLHALSHTCCIAHLGTYPPNVCVGTPCWMAPEVFQAMHEKNQYGLEVDIWSFGCFLLEMLTLRIPYQGLPDSEIYDLIKRKKQRPRLTQELEAFWTLDEPITRLKLGITSGAHAEKLRLLIDLFYQCTGGIASKRPKAEQIYNSLCSLPTCYDMR
uniref:Serine/threonine receptor-like cytoplasmic kinase n=1 Tax=Bambusa balcooa TaxID=288444 RepID=J9QBD9_9POAL|nr:serine/threonine receptor-like cytoplasmic kinase [Bambusa balcooa]